MGQQRALTRRLMEQVVGPANLNRAYRRVRANKGGPGADGMTVEELGSWLVRNKDEVTTQLLSGDYKPQSVRGVKIPKPSGGMRQLSLG
jgi:RNA-directed DNA polymerase